MDINSLGVAAIPVITVICFLIAEGIKATSMDSKWIPIICGGVGGVLGVAAMKVMADFPANDILTAFAIGIVSGLGATGAHQIYKQLTKGSTTTVEVIETAKQYQGKH